MYEANLTTLQNSTLNPSINDSKTNDALDKLGRLLPDILKEDLDMIIIGIAPSAALGYSNHHFSGPGNHFWRCIAEVGIVPGPVTCEDDGLMLDYGIGFISFCTRPSKSTTEMSRKDIKAGAAKMIEKIQKYRPKIVVFNGIGIYEAFIGNKNFSMGLQPNKMERTDSYIFVMPSSSARCAQLPRAEDKIPFFQSLKKLRDHIRGLIPHLEERDVVFQNYTEFRVTQPDPRSLIKAERRRKRKVDDSIDNDGSGSDHSNNVTHNGVHMKRKCFDIEKRKTMPKDFYQEPSTGQINLNAPASLIASQNASILAQNSQQNNNNNHHQQQQHNLHNWTTSSMLNHNNNNNTNPTFHYSTPNILHQNPLHSSLPCSNNNNNFAIIHNPQIFQVPNNNNNNNNQIIPQHHNTSFLLSLDAARHDTQTTSGFICTPLHNTNDTTSVYPLDDSNNNNNTTSIITNNILQTNNQFNSTKNYSQNSFIKNNRSDNFPKSYSSLQNRTSTGSKSNTTSFYQHSSSTSTNNNCTTTIISPNNSNCLNSSNISPTESPEVLAMKIKSHLQKHNSIIQSNKPSNRLFNQSNNMHQQLHNQSNLLSSTMQSVSPIHSTITMTEPTNQWDLFMHGLDMGEFPYPAPPLAQPLAEKSAVDFHHQDINNSDGSTPRILTVL